MNYNKKQNHSFKNLSDCIKILSVDAIEKASSGHPGMVLGFSQIMTVLAFNFLKFNPQDSKWFNRDRLVLSAGHGSMLLYSFFYLAGYKGFTLEDIKNFRQLHSKTAGHPEHGLFDAIETTTGPLGQGLANSVGMAIAQKKYQDRLGKKICDYKIYSIVGDGCLMEGISYEAASLAGHLNLNNLIILFDDNNISIDGSTDLSVSENHLKKFAALGFNVAQIDGHDFEQIQEALANAQTSDKPSFIACKTIIGKGAKQKENSAKSHGSPLGIEEVNYLKQNIAFAKDEAFYIDPELKLLWQESWSKSKLEYDLWQKDFDELSSDEKEYIIYPDFSKSLNSDFLFSLLPEATRVSSGKIIENLMQAEQKIICGSADLAGSNSMNNKQCKAISAKDFSGNFIHYGVRENAMSAIMNGLSLSGFLPVGGTFFVFSDYMRPSVRLSAIMGLQIIYVMTHDSIGLGEDGATHQPIEHLVSFRAMPNIDVFRPADFIETKECYELALQNKNKPSMMVLSRQALPQIRECHKENLSAKGGYVISEATSVANIDIVIFATGSEVSIAIEVQKKLQQKNKSVRVCSVPSVDILYSQDSQYLDDLQNEAKLIVVIEAASIFSWHKILGKNGLFFGMDSFGASAPASDLYRYFGLEPNKITESILLRCSKIS